MEVIPRMWIFVKGEESEERVKKFWQLVHHLIAHPLIGLSLGQVWAWKFHDWTAQFAWPDQKHEVAQRWAGLE